MLATMTDDISMRGKIGELLRYWQSLNSGATPARSQIDPAAIKKLLPHIYMVDLEAEPFRVRYRLAGTAADQWNGFSLVGRSLDEFLQNDLYGANKLLIELYHQIWTTGQPAFGAYRWPTRSGYMTQVPFGLFPLTVDGVVTQAISIEEVEAAPITDEWVPFVDPAKKK